MARAIEQRIIERFQDVVDDDLVPASGAGNASGKKIADAQDEGVVYVYVPKAYAGDWEHFAGVVRHLYLKGCRPHVCRAESPGIGGAGGETRRPGGGLFPTAGKAWASRHCLPSSP